MQPPEPWPFPTQDSHPDAPRTQPEGAAPKDVTVEVQAVTEDTLDDAVSDTFPASDPVAVVATKVVPQAEPEAGSQNEKDPRDGA